MFRRHSRAKYAIDVIIDLTPSFWRQVIRGWIIFKIEFGPNDQMYDFLVDSIRPVVVEYHHIIWHSVSTIAAANPAELQVRSTWLAEWYGVCRREIRPM